MVHTQHTSIKHAAPAIQMARACCCESQASKGQEEDAPLWLPRWRCTGEGMSAYPGALPLLGVLPPPPPPPPVAAAAVPVAAAADAAALQGYGSSLSHTGCKRSKCSARHCGTVSSLWSDGAQQRSTVMMPPTQRAHAQCSGQQAGNKLQQLLQTAIRKSMSCLRGGRETLLLRGAFAARAGFWGCFGPGPPAGAVPPPAELPAAAGKRLEDMFFQGLKLICRMRPPMQDQTHLLAAIGCVLRPGAAAAAASCCRCWRRSRTTAGGLRPTGRPSLHSEPLGCAQQHRLSPQG